MENTEIDLRWVAKDLRDLEHDLCKKHKHDPLAVYVYLMVFSDLSGSIVVELGRETKRYPLNHTTTVDRIGDQFDWLVGSTINKIREELL